MKLKSSQLAHFIIQSLGQDNWLIDRLEGITLNNGLIKILLAKDEEQLAYWLHLHSFMKHRLEKALEGTAEIASNPSPEQVKIISTILKSYVNNLIKKRDIAQFVVQDFGKFPYLEQKNNLTSVQTILSNNLPICEDVIKYLLNSKNRRYAELGRNLSIIYISAPNYASQFTTKKLVKSILKMSPGERKQFLYYHRGEQHAFGFDVEVDKNGKINIFSFEPAGDTRHLNSLELLYEALVKSGKQFDLRACVGHIQKDMYNCAVYTLSVLNEFSKYEHVFDYLPKQYEEDLETKSLKKAELHNRELGTKEVFSFSKLDKISWVKLSDMPARIISLGQSYTEMEESLKKARDFDLDPRKLVEQVKKRDQFSEGQPQQTKYAQRKRQRINKYLKQAEKSILEESYKEYADKFPILKSIDKGELIDFHQWIIQDPSSLDEKIILITDLLRFLYSRNGISEHVNENTYQLIPKSDVKAILQLKNELIYLLSLKPFSEFEARIKNYDDVLSLAIEHYSRQENFGTTIPHATDQIWKYMDSDKILALHREANYLPSWMRLSSPLPKKLPTPLTSITSEYLTNSIDQFVNRYVDSKGKAAITVGKIIDFLDDFYQLIAEEVYQRYEKLGAADATDDEVRVIVILRNVCLHYIRQEPDIQKMVGHFLKQLMTNKLVDESKIDNLQPPVISPKETRQKLFHKFEFDYINNSHESNLDVDVYRAGFYNLLGDKNKGLTTTSILELLDEIDNVPEKLNLLEKIYQVIITLPNEFYAKSGSFRYSRRQVNDIVALKKAYIQIVEHVIKQNDNELIEKVTKLIAEKKNSLIDFHEYSFAENFKTNTRKKLNEILGLETKRPELQSKSEKTNLIAKSSSSETSSVRMFKPPIEINKNDIGQVAVAYYYSDLKTDFKDPFEQYHVVTYAQFNYCMAVFQTNQFSPSLSRWFSFQRTDLGQPDKENKWKFNIGVSKEDISKALEIIMRIVAHHKVGSMKVMSQEQAAVSSMTTLGREFVIYCEYNPEFTSEKWIEVISEIEKELQQANIKPSRDDCPVTNRRLGMYSSYTNEIWTLELSENIPFDEGIRETGLEDEDPFRDYNYDDDQKMLVRENIQKINLP